MAATSIELSAKERAVAVDHARDDLYFYSRYMMQRRRGIRWLRAGHHTIICDALTRVFLGLCQLLIINIPPRYGKTELIRNFVAWSLGKVPDSEFIYASYGALLAAESTSAIRDTILDPEYLAVFPDVRLATEGMAHWKTTAGGVIHAAGTDGTITGFGAGKKREGFGGALIIDDAHKPSEVYSDVSREKVISTFQNTIENRLNWPTTPTIVIGQCLHEADLPNWLRNGGTGQKWESIVLPALQADGTALWPEMHSVEALRRMQAANPHNFAGQYQQVPRPPGGAFFEEKMLLVPSSVIGPDGEPIMHPVEMPAVLNYVFAIIDTAIKTGKEHDGTGVVYFGRSTNLGGPPLTVLDWDYEQIQGASLETWLPKVFARLEELGRQCHAIRGSQGAWIEDKGSGMVLLQQAANKGWPARAIESKLSSMGKDERGMAASHHVSPGHVKIARPAYVKTLPFKGVVKNHFLSQVLGFRLGSKSNSADDLYDGLCYGVVIALGGPDGI